MIRKQPISNKSFGKLLKLFKKHMMDYIKKSYDFNKDIISNPYVIKYFIDQFENGLDAHIIQLHKKYKGNPFKKLSKYTFKTGFGEVKFGYQFDKEHKNINFKMLVKHNGKAKFERKRQMNIKIK